MCPPRQPATDALGLPTCIWCGDRYEIPFDAPYCHPVCRDLAQIRAAENRWFIEDNSAQASDQK